MNRLIAVQRLKRYLALVLILLTLAFSVGPVASAQTRRYRRHRTFWKKHRDKLTVVGTTLGGAAIGSLVGAGSGAVYTYKIRKRHRHPRYRRY